MEKTRNLLKNKRLREIALYLFFGGLTTLINWAVYFGLTALLKPETARADAAAWASVNGAQVAAWITAVAFAYLTNKRYVFQSKQKKLGALQEFLLFMSGRVLSLLIFDLLLFNICVFHVRWPDGPVKIVMNVLVVIFNYFASRYVVFREKKKRA